VVDSGPGKKPREQEVGGDGLEVVESLACVECGSVCAATREGDLLVARCPRGCRVYALTVAAPGEAPPEGADPLIGQTVGPCRFVSRLGWEGGFALYEGLDVALNQPHSLLVLRGEAARDAKRARAFVRAGKLAAAVRHAALANVTQLGRISDGLFAVAPALEGKPLEEMLSPGRGLGVGEVLRIARGLADALSKLHTRGIVHRNIGPKTLFILPDGEPVLRNFAFAVGPEAKADPKLVVGQPGYIAPEVLMGRGADHRADLFSLGALLFLAFTGGPLFPGGGPAETIASQKAGVPQARGPLEACAPPEMVEIVVAMLSEDPGARPQSAAEVLEALLTASPSAAPAPEPPKLAFDESELAVVEPTVAAEPAPPEAPAAPPEPQPESKEVRDFLDVVSRAPEPQPSSTQVESEAPGAAQQPAPAPLSAEEERQLRLEGEEEAEPEPEPEPQVEEPERWTPKRKALVAAGAAVLAFILALFIKLAFFPSRGPEPSLPQRTTGKKVSKKRKPTPQEKAEAEAKVELARLELMAKKNARRPEAIVKQCDEFLKKYGRMSVAAKARQIRAQALKALHEAQASAEAAAFRSLFRDPRVPHEQKMQRVAAFLAKYGDTEAAKDLAEQRDAYLAAREAAASQALKRVEGDLRANLTAGAYGKVIAVLEPLVEAHRGTKAGAEAARQLAGVKARLAADFAALKDAARQLVRQCRFSEAIAKFKPALETWQAPNYQDEATRIVGLIRARREKVVADYAVVLKGFRDAVVAFDLARAVEACRQAESKADHAAMKELTGGLRADAEALTRLPALVVAGAKAQAAEASKTDGRIWLQQRLGRFRALLKTVEPDGIEVEMPGHKGKLTWNKLPVGQLVEFARSAPQKTAEDHRAIGLLALIGGMVETAYEEFAEAVQADPTAARRVRGSLSRLLGGFVHIPAGKFLAGRRNEPVELAGYFLGAREVTNAEYAFYLKATNRPAPPDWKDGTYRRGYGEFPVVNITWEEASAYAAWAGARLPTAHEWERAVRGTDGRLYPWGNDFDPSRVNFARKSGRAVVQARLMRATRHFWRRDTSPFFHLLGNAREWTATVVGRNREGKALYAVVGGSAADDQRALVPHQYRQQEGGTRDPFTGFRLAWPR